MGGDEDWAWAWAWAWAHVQASTYVQAQVQARAWAQAQSTLGGWLLLDLVLTLLHGSPSRAQPVREEVDALGQAPFAQAGILHRQHPV